MRVNASTSKYPCVAAGLRAMHSEGARRSHRQCRPRLVSAPAGQRRLEGRVAVGKMLRTLRHCSKLRMPALDGSVRSLFENRREGYADAPKCNYWRIDDDSSCTA